MYGSQGPYGSTCEYRQLAKHVSVGRWGQPLRQLAQSENSEGQASTQVTQAESSEPASCPRTVPAFFPWLAVSNDSTAKSSMSRRILRMIVISPQLGVSSYPVRIKYIAYITP